MNNESPEGFMKNNGEFLNDMGIVKYEEKFSLWNTAKHCAATAGVATAGAGAVMTGQAGTAFVPGIGTVAGAVGGALAGMFYGTVACTAMNASVRKGIKEIFKKD